MSCDISRDMTLLCKPHARVGYGCLMLGLLGLDMDDSIISRITMEIHIQYQAAEPCIASSVHAGWSAGPSVYCTWGVEPFCSCSAYMIYSDMVP